MKRRVLILEQAASKTARSASCAVDESVSSPTFPVFRLQSAVIPEEVGGRGRGKVYIHTHTPAKVEPRCIIA